MIWHHIPQNMALQLPAHDLTISDLSLWGSYLYILTCIYPDILPNSFIIYTQNICIYIIAHAHTHTCACIYIYIHICTYDTYIYMIHYIYWQSKRIFSLCSTANFPSSLAALDQWIRSDSEWPSLRGTTHAHLGVLAASDDQMSVGFWVWRDGETVSENSFVIYSLL